MPNLVPTEGSELVFLHVFGKASDDSIVNFGLKNSGASEIVREKSLQSTAGRLCLGVTAVFNESLPLCKLRSQGPANPLLWRVEMP